MEFILFYPIQMTAWVNFFIGFQIRIQFLVLKILFDAARLLSVPYIDKIT